MREGDRPDVGLVTVIIQAQFPQITPTRVVYVGEGCDSTAFDVNDAWVFKFPKRADVERQLLIEMAMLPVLAESTPVPIPAFCFRGQPSPEFPRHFAGYRRLPGQPAIHLEYSRIPFVPLAATIARFLSWLHAFPVNEAARCGVPTQPIESLIDEVRADALRDFELVSRLAADAPLENWYAYLKDGVPADPSPSSTTALVHNDFAAEHILLDPADQSVTGIIDWSDIAVGNPAADFAGVFHWGGDALVHAVLSTYTGRIDALALSRARFMGACRGVGDVAFGVATNRREYIAAGVRALELCIVA